VARLETSDKYTKLIAECDQLIMAANLNAVTHLISKLKLAHVPRHVRQDLAKICRRAGLINHGLRLLQPLIHNEKLRQNPATAGEICEYGVLLSRNGSVQEALSLLTKVDPEKAPEALLYSSYCHITNWDFSQAAFYLQQFLKVAADPYIQLVARVNLAYSYLESAQLKSAYQFILETKEIADQLGSKRLVGNCLLLLGQLHFNENNFAKSREALESARQIFGANKSYDELLISKWLAVMSALDQKSSGPLLAFRKEAEEREHWESVRDADFFLLKIKFDQILFDHLLFGTPMKSYRERILAQLGGTPSPRYLFGSSRGPCLNLDSGKVQNGPAIEAGKKPHQVFAGLLKDFYVPRNIGTLYSYLYPGEHFDINSSPLKVRQQLWRARNWLVENNIPAKIVQTHSSYKLNIDGDFGIKVSLASAPTDFTSVKWRELQRAFPAGTRFSAEQACEKLNLSRSAFYRLVRPILIAGQLLKFGENKSTQYEMPLTSSAIKAA
jgi:tetratricopeptide (TPR) repeat protein